MEKFVGKFAIESSENFEPFLSALGVGLVTRKMAGTASPVITIDLAGDQMTIKTTTTFKNSEIKFKLGEEFEEDRLDGQKVKSVVTLENGKLVQKQFGTVECKIEREITEDGKLKTVCECKDVVSTRVYAPKK